jgi:succinyl-diaminopimelate desuccinylase
MLDVDERAGEEAVRLTQDLVRIRTENPPGAEEAAARYCRDFLAGAGIGSTLVPLEDGRSSLVARIPGRRNASVVLCGHLDTVAVGESPWAVPPFEGRRVSERIHGRGAADMKGGAAVLLEVAKLLAVSGAQPRESLVLALTADEEGTYRGARSVREAGLLDDARLLIVAEPTEARSLVGQKGELWVEAEFTGKGAHGSVPEQGVNAILPACEFATALADEVRGFRELPGRGRTSLNVGVLEGGWRPNVVPETARVKLDFRPVSLEDERRALAAVRMLGERAAERAGAAFSSRVASNYPPVSSDPAHPEVRRFLTAVSGRGEGNGSIAPYCTDAVEIAPQLGIPVVLYGPGSIAQAHRPDEYLEVASLWEALEGLTRYAALLCAESV